MNIRMKYDFYHEMGALYPLPNDHAVDLIKRLHVVGKLIRKHKKACEAACNTGLELHDVAIENIELKILKVLDSMNNDIADMDSPQMKFSAIFQHDPRGNTARIFLHDRAMRPEMGRQMWAVLQ